MDLGPAEESEGQVRPVVLLAKGVREAVLQGHRPGAVVVRMLHLRRLEPEDGSDQT
jgi:hypothetical protein